ncbi:S8 family peptidase [Rothia endophytica]|uniref:S8 family peptidase n=1 Tax=Rothia endophytica TaxID=1324766 RepID=UPI001F214E4B|nr:S8 family peptidase [Rothia endophytica]
MAETPSSNTPRRRLFTNGEALKIEVSRVNSGRNNKFHPQSALEAATLLRPQVDIAMDARKNLPPELISDILYFELRLLPNYLAASAFPERLASYLEADLVGVKTDSSSYRTASRQPILALTKNLVFASQSDALERLSALINGEETNDLGDRAFDEDLRKFDVVKLSTVDELAVPVTSEKSRGRITWEAVLHPQGRRDGKAYALDPDRIENWHAAVLNVGGELHTDYERIVGGITFSPVTMSLDSAQYLRRFNGLRALRPLPKIRPRPSVRSRSAAFVHSPGTHKPLREDIRVAVFDGGIESFGRRPSLFPVREFDITPEASDRGDLSHGTAVVGASLYGLLDSGDQAPRPAVNVDSYRVFPAPDIEGDLWGYWMLDQIVEVVKKGEHQIVNLSLGPEKSVEDFAEPDRWTSELDKLAHEMGVLFVVAAGNSGEWSVWEPNSDFHRVQVPADMVNGLTVGSCTLPYPEKKWERAPYSSMGPGRHGSRIQPIGVQYGGTEEEGMPLLREDGTVMRNHGTSFSAPLMTHALSRLAAELPTFNANTLRAFAVHFAERHRAYRAKVNEHGFGRFLLDYTQKLNAEADEAHVLFEDSAIRSTLLGYQIPLPARSLGELEIRITLSYTSTVDIAQTTDYTDSSIDLTFRPHSEIRTYTSPDETRKINLDRRSDEAFRLLSEGWKDSREAPTLTLAPVTDRSEAKLRESGKWETLRHYRVKVPAGGAHNPRLEVGYLAREAGTLSDHAPDLPFSLLVTVCEPGAPDFYDGVAKAYPALRALQNVSVPIQISPSV